MRKIHSWMLDEMASKGRETLEIIGKEHQLKGLQGQITDPRETAFMSYVIRELDLQNILEIGTYFAATTHLIACSKVGNLKVVTIDPFGRERVPDLLADFPADIRKKIHFLPMNSMDYFANHASLAKSLGVDYYDLVFIDGNHNYEYALFDIIASSKTLSEKGLLVIDNFDQIPVKQAVIDFLQREAGWNLITSDVHRFANLEVEHTRIDYFSDQCAVLFPPEYIYINDFPTTFNARFEKKAIDSLVFYPKNRIDGTLKIECTVICWPYDHHITGKNQRFYSEYFEITLFEASSKVVVDLLQSKKPLKYDHSSYTTCEIHVSFFGKQKNMLLSLDCPIEINTSNY